MIKIVHRFWDGPNPMPERHQFFGDEWRRLNPDWDLIDWDLGSVYDNFAPVNQSVLDDLANQASNRNADLVANATHVADVLGYEIIYKYGGLYVNTDIRPIRPIADIVELNPELNVMAAAGKEDDYWVVNAALWAPEKHQLFWGRVIDALPGRYFSMPGAFMNATTGPHLLTAVYEANPGELHVLDRDTFNPIHWSEFGYGEYPEYDPATFPPGTLGVHEWFHRTNQRNQRTLEQ